MIKPLRLDTATNDNDCGIHNLKKSLQGLTHESVYYRRERAPAREDEPDKCCSLKSLGLIKNNITQHVASFYKIGKTSADPADKHTNAFPIRSNRMIYVVVFHKL